MREFTKPNWDWYMDIRQLSEITKEVYGIEYDLQMGERGQGEHEIVSTNGDYERQGYQTGLGTGHRYADKYVEGHAYVYFSDSPEAGSEASQAMAKWVAQIGTVDDEGRPFNYLRPFEKVRKSDGQYVWWQPELGVVIEDLAKRLEIPEGTYYISIDW